MKTNYSSFNDFLADASIKFERMKIQDPKIRYGQVYSYLLSAARPDIAELVRGTLHDSFYKDIVSSESHKFVESKW